MSRRTIRLITVVAASMLFAGPIGVAPTSARTAGVQVQTRTVISMAHECHVGKAHPYSMYSTKVTKNGLKVEQPGGSGATA
jgi:hypothetical protein